jgi:hypothetical protein
MMSMKMMIGITLVTISLDLWHMVRNMEKLVMLIMIIIMEEKEQNMGYIIMKNQ